MNFFDFLMAMSRNNGGFAAQQPAFGGQGMAGGGFLPPQIAPPMFGPFMPSGPTAGPSSGGNSASSRNQTPRGSANNPMLAGPQFGLPTMAGNASRPQMPFQAAPIPAAGPQLVGGPLPGIQYQPSAPMMPRPPAPSGASSRTSSSGSSYNSFLGQGFQPTSFGGG